MTQIAGINVKCGDGDNSIIINGTGNVTVGDGNNGILTTGDNSSVNAGHGDNEVVFNGDNFTGKFGDGNNTVMTLDVANDNDLYLEYKDKVKTESTTTSEKELLSSKQDGSSGLINSLSSAEQSIAQNINFSEMVGSNYRYVVALAPDGQYHIYEKCNNTSRYKSVVGVSNGSNYLTPSQIQSTGGTVTFTDTYKTTNTNVSQVVGVYNPNLSFGNGNNNVTLTLKDENAEINAGHGDNDINVGLGKDTKKTTTVTEETTTENRTSTIQQGSGSFGSPLIIDMNKDGVVSAEAGKGVDINNDGQADGAAVNGDKMLAMQDINGNGKIDGAEVFGDKTVNPFTGEALNAANGFEALKLVAKSAEENTGIKCYNNGEVDLSALNQALQSIGQQLGFISDNNTSQLEALNGVSKINVDNYSQSNNESGDVQHKQQGTATFNDGSSTSIHDVWFAYNNASLASRLAVAYTNSRKK